MSDSWAEKRLAEVAARKAELLGRLATDEERIAAYRAALRGQNTRGGRFLDRLSEEVQNILDRKSRDRGDGFMSSCDPR